MRRSPHTAFFDAKPASPAFTMERDPCEPERARTLADTIATGFAAVTATSAAVLILMPAVAAMLERWPS